MVPELFAPGIVTLPGTYTGGITFSADGNEIYFGRFTMGDLTNTLWVTRQADGVWSTPAPLASCPGGGGPFLSPDGARMYFTAPMGVLDSQMWFIERVGEGWSSATKLTAPLSTRPKVFPTVAANGNLYFTQIETNYQGRYYMAPWRNGSFGVPVLLPSTVNRFITNDFVFVAPDESYLVLGAVPASDTQRLFVSFKRTDGTWGVPIELGAEVNATNDLISPSISPDGKYLFFTRNTSGSSSIWWVDARVVFDLRPAVQGPEPVPLRGEGSISAAPTPAGRVTPGG